MDEEIEVLQITRGTTPTVEIEVDANLTDYTCRLSIGKYEKPYFTADNRQMSLTVDGYFVSDYRHTIAAGGSLTVQFSRAGAVYKFVSDDMFVVKEDDRDRFPSLIDRKWEWEFSVPSGGKRTFTLRANSSSKTIFIDRLIRDDSTAKSVCSFKLTQAQTLACKPGDALLQMRAIKDEDVIATEAVDVEVLNVIEQSEIVDTYDTEAG